MELLKGESLDAMVRREKRLPVSDAVGILIEASRAGSTRRTGRG